MFNIFITVFITILCFQGAYAEQETENGFTKHLTCFKALKGKTFHKPIRYASNYFEKAVIALLPHPLHSHTWLLLTKNSIYQQHFFERENESYNITENGLIETLGNHFELTLSSGQRIHLLFRYKQYSMDAPLQPALSANLIKSRTQVCAPSFCTTLVPNEEITDETRNIVIDSLRKRIQTVHRKFSEFNSQDRPANDFIDALNMCKGINDDIDSIIVQETEKF